MSFVVAAIKSGYSDLLKKSRHSLVENRVAIPAGLLCQGASKITFAGTGRSGYQAIGIENCHPPEVVVIY